jgi:hypothetical protein
VSCQPRKPIQQDDLIYDIDQVDEKLIEFLSLVETAMHQSTHDNEFPPF